MGTRQRTACFFSNGNGENLSREQYSIQDINILRDLGFTVQIATNFAQIPWNSDLYFSWWATGSIMPLLKAKARGRPIIVVAGGNEVMRYRDSKSGVPLGYLASPWYKKLAARLTLRYATKVLVVSAFMLDDVRKLGARDPLVIHNSVDRRKFRSAQLQREFVTSIFNLDESVVDLKRGDVFIKAIPLVLREYPEQQFLVLGRKGNAFERIHRSAVALGISDRLTFLGYVDNAAVPGWLQRSKAYVQISDTETFGVTIAEAMSCGTPVLVSRRGAIPEIVGEHGFYVDHNDEHSVAEGIIRILRLSAAERDHICARGADRIDRLFTFERRRDRIKKLVEEVLP
ncbi:N-acetyl-alpha-D-glucosaminyl L-malate synthase [Planctomycetaceae bacterium]|nr:N-acetyl-alpha-D-glucosaminyl L-malate synthase [Planctomycetaceae bacterium]